MAIYWWRNSSLTTLTHRIVVIAVSLTMAACTQLGNSSFRNTAGVPALIPKATISLKYPNPWDINNQIALSNDGSRLIDASSGARYIRVWDWQNNKVAQQLLLNEEAPEGKDNKSHDFKLVSTPGKELALSPDGKLMAACLSTGKGQIRVWSLESGAVAMDIPYLHRHVPNLDQNRIFGLGCSSISFSPNGKYMGVLNEGANMYADEDHLKESQTIDRNNNESSQISIKTGKETTLLTKPKDLEVAISGLAIFSTDTWKLEQLFYRPLYRQPQFKSRPLFDADSKTLSAVIFDQAPVGVWNTWVGNRIVRWDIASGTQLEENDMPQLVNGENGLWWTSLPSGREVWWQVNNNSTSVVKESRPCKQNPPPSPTFFSDEKFNCDYAWLLATLNLDTRKIRYLAPYKNDWSLEPNEETYKWAGISPDGAHIVLVRGKGVTKKRVSTVEVLDRETLRLEGSYSAELGIFPPVVFSSDSKYFSFSFFKPSFLRSSYGQEFAMIFELPKKQ